MLFEVADGRGVVAKSALPGYELTRIHPVDSIASHARLPKPRPVWGWARGGGWTRGARFYLAS